MTTVHLGGRPIDVSAAPKLMEAARVLVTRHGYAGVTIAMIADAAGVGRQMVYRRWRSKADLVMDAYLDRAETISEISDGPVQEMLETFLTQLFAGLDTDGPAIRSLIAAAQEDDTFRATFDERFTGPRDEVVMSIFRKGISNQELSPDVDIKLLAEIVHGAFWYRLLIGRPLDGDFARDVAKSVIIVARPSAHGAGC